MARTQNFLEIRSNSLTKKFSQPQDTSSQTSSQNFENSKNGKEFEEDALIEVVEIEDNKIFKDRIITGTKIKIKEDTGTIPEETIEEIIIEETNREGTIMEIIQTMTAEIIIFNEFIIQMLKRP